MFIERLTRSYKITNMFVGISLTVAKLSQQNIYIPLYTHYLQFKTWVIFPNSIGSEPGIIFLWQTHFRYFGPFILFRKYSIEYSISNQHNIKISILKFCWSHTLLEISIFVADLCNTSHLVPLFGSDNLPTWKISQSGAKLNI